MMRLLHFVRNDIFALSLQGAFLFCLCEGEPKLRAEGAAAAGDEAISGHYATNDEIASLRSQ
jgi:hypothetical protein